MTNSKASLGGAIPNAAWVPTDGRRVIGKGKLVPRAGTLTHGGTDIKTVAFLVWYPVLVGADEPLDEFNDRVPIEALSETARLRDSDSGRACKTYR